MNKVSNVITALSVTIFMAVMFVFTLISEFTLGNKDTSAEEKKSTLGTLFSVIGGDLGDEYTQRFADNFSGRIDWVAIDARLESTLCERIVNGVYIADDRLIAADNSGKTISEDCIDSINSFAGSYDGAVYFVAVPGSAGIYSETLPEYMDQRTQKQLTDRFYDCLDPGIRRIDAYNRLKMLSNNYVYYRSDNKWTSYGAYCVYRTVIQKLGFEPSSYDKYSIEHVTDSFYGELYDRTQYMHCSPDILDIYSYSGGTEVTGCRVLSYDGNEIECQLYNRDALRTKDKYALYPGVGFPKAEIETSAGNERKLLVIGDDYAANFVPFLLQHYSEITVIYPEHTSGKLSEYTEIGDYEQTLFLFGIDSLCDRNILDKLLEE